LASGPLGCDFRADKGGSFSGADDASAAAVDSASVEETRWSVALFVDFALGSVAVVSAIACFDVSFGLMHASEAAALSSDIIGDVLVSAGALLSVATAKDDDLDFPLDRPGDDSFLESVLVFADSDCTAIVAAVPLFVVFVIVLTSALAGTLALALEAPLER